MALFHAAVGRDSVSLLMVKFLSHVQDFSSEISLVCRLKYPYSSFSSYFYFLVIFVLLMHVLRVLFLVVVIINPIHFYVIFESLYRCIDAVLNASESSSSSFDTRSLSMSSLSCKALCIVTSFLILRSICFSSLLVHFRNGPEYLGTA